MMPRRMEPFTFLLLMAVGLSACGGAATDTPAASQGVTVDVQPRIAQVVPSGTVPFTSVVSGTNDRTVVWEVVEAGGGTIDATGRYTAPATTGQFHVRVSSHADPSAQAVAAVTVAAQVIADTLQVQGRHLLDTCGNRLVIRGVEESFGIGIDVRGSWSSLVDQIALTGSNAFRLLPNMSQLTTADVDGIIGRAVYNQMVVFLSVGTANRAWFGQAATKAMIARYKKWIVLDALEEVTFDDRTRWQSEAIAAIGWFRGQGYTEPVTVIANNYGRDLQSLLRNGAAVVAADPLGRTVLGWQAYWGNNDYWQGVYGLTLAEGIDQAALQPFPIQLGIIDYTDWFVFGPTVTMDFVPAMARAQANGVGWLWWDYYNPFDTSTSLSPFDGMADNLDATGNVVVNTDPNGIRSTSQRACGR